MEKIDTTVRVLMTDELFEKLGFKKRKSYYEGSIGYKYDKIIKIGRGHKSIEERISVKKDSNNHYLIRHEFLGQASIDGTETLCAKFGGGSVSCQKTISYFDELCDYLRSRQSFMVMEDAFLLVDHNK